MANYCHLGLQLEYYLSGQGGVHGKTETPKHFFELSAETCLRFLKCLDNITYTGPAPGFGQAVSPPGVPTPLSATTQSSLTASSPTALQMANSTGPNVTNFIEYAVHRVPSMLFLEGLVIHSFSYI